MIELTDEQLRQIQLTELEMLVEIDRICRKCGIRYNIIAGTLLGAVRHGGFIPWDDDADVALLRPEYEKFRVACENELDTSRFYFQDHRNTPGYRWGYGKLRRKGTLFLREYQEHMPYEQGIFIDIFPLDNVPDNYFLRCLHNFHCFCIRKVLWSEVGKIADKSALKRAFYHLLSEIPLSTIFSHYEAFAKRGNVAPTKMVRILTFPTPNDAYGYEKVWYEISEDIRFEGKVFQGIKDYDSYLSFKFGEYMTLPPPEERKVHAVSALRLQSIQGIMDRFFSRCILENERLYKEWEKTSKSPDDIRFIKIFFSETVYEDLVFLNTMIGFDDCKLRHQISIIRMINEQCIEFIYMIQDTSYIKAYLGSENELDEIEKISSDDVGQLVKELKKMCGNRFNGHKRTSIIDMAKQIGEYDLESVNNTERLPLYIIYQILSDKFHNSYYEALLHEISLDETQDDSASGEEHDFYIMLLDMVISTFEEAYCSR